MNETARAGLKITRTFTTLGRDVFADVPMTSRSSVISNPDGSIVAQKNDIEVPLAWSQLATDIVVSKYFRKSGLHGRADLGETSAVQVVTRIADAITNFGDKQGYFANAEDRDTFNAELKFLLINQYAAFNSPVWFNCGLFEKYGITGSGGTWAMFDENGDKFVDDCAHIIRNTYARPQCSACFIQSAEDDLMSIFELIKNEARLFKYGSGTGSNFSKLRGYQEKISGGGNSSGLMSFLEVFDRAAGSTKSGGVTRRAAKMVSLDMDHPEIVDFIECKMKEERKVATLIAGGYPSDFNGEAYHTVAFQNANHSVRVSDEFMCRVADDGEWNTIARTTGKVVDTYKARDLYGKIVESAWSCADPGVQYDTTINKWHTCKVTGRIYGSNPCSEFMFLDDTACNLSSVNLTKFLKRDDNGVMQFDHASYIAACRIMFIAQDILVDYSSYPTEIIARNSHEFRPLGLGYANLGSMLMMLGVSYDSDVGRSIAGALTAIMTGSAYSTSGALADAMGPFAGFALNRESMLDVMRMHKDAVADITVLPHTDLTWRMATKLKRVAETVWQNAVALGEKHGYRNAQATVLAPTGTIGLLMDCDTTGIEPDFSLVKSKKLAGGGSFKIVNQSVEPALVALGYPEAQVAAIIRYLSGTNKLPANVESSLLERKILSEDAIARVNAALLGAFSIEDAFNPKTLGGELQERYGIAVDKRLTRALLAKILDMTVEELRAMEKEVLGAFTVEGAPHLKTEHYSVFDCANKCGMDGTRCLAAMAHVKMMAAAQPFLSGAISKTVNLPPSATREEVAEIYHEGWHLGLKAVALYRDGCKMSQPLSSGNAHVAPDGTVVHVSAATPAEVISRMNTTEIAETQRLLLDHPAAEQVRVERFGLLQPRRGRERMPRKAYGPRHELTIGGQKFWLKHFDYDDGRIGEIWIDLHKEGSPLRAVLNHFAMSISMGLQHGVPLREYVDMFTLTEYEPNGVVTGHDHVKMSNSISDAVFRILACEYLGDDELAQVKMTPEQKAEALGLDDEEEDERTTVVAAHPITVTSPQITPEIQMVGGAQTRDCPPCPKCGRLTVRNGACFRCHNCGESLGCS